MAADVKFSHQTNVYVFIGKKLDLPAPGTYDASSWTPPTHQIFRVEIQDDGIWLVKLGNAQIASGEGAKRSRSGAELILNQIARRF